MDLSFGAIPQMAEPVQSRCLFCPLRPRKEVRKASLPDVRIEWPAKLAVKPRAARGPGLHGEGDGAEGWPEKSADLFILKPAAFSWPSSSGVAQTRRRSDTAPPAAMTRTPPTLRAGASMRCHGRRNGTRSADTWVPSPSCPASL